MKMIKLALLGGAAVAVTAASAQADDLESLKAQIAELNARMAAMETAPSIPAGYQLVAMSEGDIVNTPGLGFTARELASYGERSTIISVLPTADAPAGTTITWSGYARAGAIYENVSTDNSFETFNAADGNLVDSGSTDTDTDDYDVKARGQFRVTASTDTAVGEVGVDLRMRANFNGNGEGDVYMNIAWGYWAMTPELTFGGGYAGSLGNISYGYDGACTCYYTDNADLDFNPGDVTQMRMSYASDGSIRTGANDFGANDRLNGDQLGAAGEIKYSGDTFSGEIAGVYRNVDDEEYSVAGFAIDTSDIDADWQVGAGVGFQLGDVANFSLGAAMGEGPFTQVSEGAITGELPINQSWWGVSGLVSFSVSDEISMELGAGYKKRDGDDLSGIAFDGGLGGGDADFTLEDVEYETYGVLGGIYYNPVDQLTIGLEAEWYTVKTDYTGTNDDGVDVITTDGERESTTTSVNLVSLWRF
jgi:hypothetical protein